MLFLIVRCLRQYRWFALLGGALLLSSVGNGLTYVIVFGKLLSSEAKPSALTLAYILTLSPGIPGSLFAEKLLFRMPLLPILILSESIGLAGLAFPWWALDSDSQLLLLASQGVAAFAGGMMVPVLSQILKNGLSPADLPAASSLETLIFAANVIFGIGLGTLLYGHVPPSGLLALDAISFVLSIGLLIAAHRVFRGVAQHTVEDSTGKIRWRALPLQRKRSLLLLPALALVGAPAMALLPALAPQFSGEATNTGLMLLLARSAGQLIGPLLLTEKQLQRYDGKFILPVLFLALFIGGYMLVSLTDKQWLAMLLIVTAHIFSNIVYVLATLNIMRTFPIALTGKAMAKSWRIQLIITLTLPVAAGLAADRYDPALVLYLCSGGGFLAVIIGAGTGRVVKMTKSMKLNFKRSR